MPAITNILTLFMLSIILVACGGGGGGGDDGNNPSAKNPVADKVLSNGDEDTASIILSLTASDDDGSISSFTLNTLPANGTLYTDSQLTTEVTAATPYNATTNSLKLYFVPTADYNGETSFDNIATDNDDLDSPVAKAIITVNPVNDAPVLTSNSLIITEGQNKLINTTDINTVDVDNNNTELSYTISNISNGQFERTNAPGTSITTFTQAEITANTIQFVHDDSEIKPAYSVSVSDGTIATTSAAANIIFNHKNDNPPQITSPSSANVVENNASVLTITAIDNDDDTLTYSIVDGADNALFTISNGVLNFINAPDFETPLDLGADNTYEVKIGVSDGLTTTTQTIVVTVTNINDNDPVFTNAATISVDENTTLIFNANAADADDDTINYSLQSGSGGEDNLLFDINTTTGALTLKNTPDFEAPADANIDNIYQVRLGASDGTKQVSQTFSITINNINDNNPVFTTTNNKIIIKEKTTTVLAVTASDSDNDTLNYLLENGTGGDDNALFDIDSATGILSFKTAPDFATPADADANNVYNVLVGVNDGATTSTLAFSVTVALINIPFTEDFSSGSDGWVFIDDYSNTSSWAVNAGVLVQSLDYGISSVTRELDNTYHRGTYAYLADGISLADYRVSADLTPIKQPGYSIYDDGHDIGLMFRYQDNNNYYRIALNSEYGYTRLDRKVAGVFSTLAVDARGYTDEGVLIHIDVEVVGDLIQVYIDGEPRFAVKDSSLSTGSVAVYTEDGAQFDNIVINYNNTTPAIVINEPAAFTAQTGSAIAVSAVVLNKPATASVEFDIDGNLCSTASETSPGYFTASCTALTQIEHTITATLKDGGTIASDSNVKVGSSAEVRLVVGDSISNGVTDTFRGDNRSDDGKVIGEQGYVGVLQNLLGNSRTARQMIYNEAVPGDESWELDQRLVSILARHPGANIAQVMIGTNDAGQSMPIPSGLGCSGAGCNGTYKENIQNIISTLTSAGVTPIIALIPPAFEIDTPLIDSRNMLTLEYNTVLLTELSIPALGPDFFNYFLSTNENRVSMYADKLHFNGLGYKIMAHLWEHYLNGGTSLPSRAQLPLVLEDICVRLTSTSCETPLQYKQDLMQVGNPYYVNDSFEIQSIPSTLTDGVWLKTANADKNNTRSDYLTFTVDRNIDLYIAYDAAATSIPPWLSGYTDTGQSLSVSNPSAPTMKIYKKSYVVGFDTPSDGTIKLGGNLAGGAVGANANYIAIFKPQ